MMETRRRAAGRLHGVVREPGVTCWWCADPTTGFDVCRHCRDHRRLVGVADVIAPLIYAIGGTESAALLRDYKNHPSGAVRRRCSDAIGSLIRSALARHEECLAAAVGLPVTVRAIVPSLSYRPGAHPFADVAGVTGTEAEHLLAPGPGTTCHRAVSADKFVVTRADAMAGRHVLVMDDVWTTGSNAQSAALACRAAGAAAVSVLVVGRWLNPRYLPTRTFIDRYLTADVDPDQCPVPGRKCRRDRGPVHGTVGGHRR